MPRGQLYINGYDAFTTWGVSLNSSGLSTLMTPPEVKAYVSNESELEDGTRVVTSLPKVKDRTISLGMHLTAPDVSTFLSRYAAFCTMLKGGTVNIRTSFQPDILYKCLFVSCTSFSEYRLGLAKFVLKLYEPNPTDRSAA